MEELENERFLFQFRHEALVEGGSWNFNNHVMISQRFKPGEDPNKVELYLIFIWLQIHQLLVGYRLNKILKGIGAYAGSWLT